MSVSVVIVSFDARDDLTRCLESIVSVPPARLRELVVVDNASSDGVPELVESRFPTVRLIRAGGNLGFARANNLGIRQTSGEHVLLLNPDTLMPPGAVDRLSQRLEELPEAAAIGPRLVDPSGRLELSWGPMPGPLAEGVQLLRGALHRREVGWVSRRLEVASRRERQVDWLSGACLLVRRRDADAAGLLDERYFLYWEDIDFCAALRARGRAVVYSPVADVIHARGRSGVGRREAVAIQYRRGQLAFYAKHRPAWVQPLRLFLRLTGRLPPPGDRL
jgi:N-acetylglucosaminyl-diphospho-decaprenol L-rhamnosyltransferase